MIPITIIILLAAIAASYAWYTRIKARRPRPELTWPERRRLMEQQLEHRMREQGLIPLETVKNRRRRDRLRRFGRNRGGIPAPMPGSADPICNRRERHQNLTFDDTSGVPFARASLGGGPGTSTPRSPNSVYTVASSDMRSPESSHWISTGLLSSVSRTATSTRGVSRTRISRTCGSQPLLPVPFSPRPVFAPQLSNVARLPLAVFADRPSRSPRTQETPGESPGALSLPPFRVVCSDTSHSLRFYRDEQMAIQQQQKEALSQKASSTLLINDKNLYGEQ